MPGDNRTYAIVFDEDVRQETTGCTPLTCSEYVLGTTSDVSCFLENPYIIPCNTPIKTIIFIKIFSTKSG
jgi:hypothetical protein